MNSTGKKEKIIPKGFVMGSLQKENACKNKVDLSDFEGGFAICYWETMAGIFSKGVEKQNRASCGVSLHTVVLISQGHLSRTTRSSSHLGHGGSILTRTL